MHHKLQNFSTENDGLDSVVRNDNSTSQAENASNDAGSASAGQPKSPVAQPPSAVTAPMGPKSKTGRGRRNHVSKSKHQHSRGRLCHELSSKQHAAR